MWIRLSQLCWRDATPTRRDYHGLGDGRSLSKCCQRGAAMMEAQ
jgi:hypothetical protein